jgi:hypothetical protein
MPTLDQWMETREITGIVRVGGCYGNHHNASITSVDTDTTILEQWL